MKYVRIIGIVLVLAACSTSADVKAIDKPAHIATQTPTEIRLAVAQHVAVLATETPLARETRLAQEQDVAEAYAAGEFTVAQAIDEIGPEVVAQYCQTFLNVDDALALEAFSAIVYTFPSPSATEVFTELLSRC